jgi:uncharacterized protein YjbI with pentapeptide repeats
MQEKPHESDNDAPPSLVRNAGASTFDTAAWFARLSHLNLWADGLTVDGDDGKFIASRRSENLRRFEAGRDEWNCWASAMLALKREAVDADLWQVAKLPHSTRATNQATRVWLSLAVADFSRHVFTSAALFPRVVFPGPAYFNSTVFGTDEHDLIANFIGATFHQTANFARTEFRGDGAFIQARFLERARFDGAVFRRNARFDRAHFDMVANFREASMNRDANFTEAIFENKADFTGAKIFSMPGSSANFRQAIFKGAATFEGARFEAPALFSATDSKVGFSLAEAKFNVTPDFIEANFRHAPRLDDCELLNPIARAHKFKSHLLDDRPEDPRPRGPLRLFAVARDKHEQARLRKLRAMASDGKDYESESIFNGYEIAARRFWIDKPSSLRFWAGWFYGLVANYGRSSTRPLMAWVLTTSLFWGAFYFSATDLAQRHNLERRCHPRYINTLYRDELEEQDRQWFSGPLGQAGLLSLRNGLIIDRLDPSASRRMFGCLFGMNGIDSSAQPFVPTSVSLLSALQSILSAVLLFFAGLGLRNMFRMKGN